MISFFIYKFTFFGVFTFIFLFFSFLLLIRLASHTEERKKNSDHQQISTQEDRRITFKDYLGYRNYELFSSHIIERYEHRKTGSAGQASISSIVTQIFLFSPVRATLIYLIYFSQISGFAMRS